MTKLQKNLLISGKMESEVKKKKVVEEYFIFIF